MRTSKYLMNDWAVNKQEAKGKKAREIAQEIYQRKNVSWLM